MESEKNSQSSSEKTPSGKKTASLQIYVLVFFAAALFFVILAAFLQQRSINTMEDALDETNETLLSKTSLLQNVQERLDVLQSEHDTLQSEKENLQQQLATAQAEATQQAAALRLESEGLARLLTCLDTYYAKDYKAAKAQYAEITALGLIGTPGTEANAIYLELGEKLSKK